MYGSRIGGFCLSIDALGGGGGGGGRQGAWIVDFGENWG